MAHEFPENAENGLNETDVCRACLSNRDTVKEIAEVEFAEIYENCTSIDVNKLKLPLFMCDHCVYKLNEFNEFRKMCLQSEVAIERIVKNQQRQVEVIETEGDLIGEIKIEQQPENDCRCVICCKDFNDGTALSKHNELLHCTCDYKCAVCEEAFNTPTFLNVHIKVLHDKDETIRKFNCARCGKLYKTIANLQTHMYTHIGIKPFQCKYCSRAFTKQATLIAHETIHTGSRTHLCSECGKCFTSAAILRRHKASHTGARPNKCALCPASFVSKGDLKVHVRSHTGEKPYLCSTCGKGFRRSTHLTVHKRIHTGEKPYECTTCGRSFAQSGDLRAHERTHTGEKPYSCVHCGKRFNQGSGLTTHMKRHKNLTGTSNKKDSMIVEDDVEESN